MWSLTSCHPCYLLSNQISAVGPVHRTWSLWPGSLFVMFALWDEVVGCIVLRSYPHWEITIKPTVFPKVLITPLSGSSPSSEGRFFSLCCTGIRCFMAFAHTVWGSRLYSFGVVILPCLEDNYTIYCLPWGVASLQRAVETPDMWWTYKSCVAQWTRQAWTYF